MTFAALRRADTLRYPLSMRPLVDEDIQKACLRSLHKKSIKRNSEMNEHRHDSINLRELLDGERSVETVYSTYFEIKRRWKQDYFSLLYQYRGVRFYCPVCRNGILGRRDPE